MGDFLPAAFASHARLAPQPARVDDTFVLANGLPARIRTARAEDGPRIQALVRGLSLESRYRRFFIPLHELAPSMLDRFTHADPLHELTLLVSVYSGGGERIVGMAQYVAEPYPERCDFAVVVDDAWQGNGIAMRLMRNLLCMARAAGIARIEGETLADNEPMRQLLNKLDFTWHAHPDGPTLRLASMTLSAPGSNCSPLAALAAQAHDAYLRDLAAANVAMQASAQSMSARSA